MVANLAVPLLPHLWPEVSLGAAAMSAAIPPRARRCNAGGVPRGRFRRLARRTKRARPEQLNAHVDRRFSYRSAQLSLRAGRVGLGSEG